MYLRQITSCFVCFLSIVIHLVLPGNNAPFLPLSRPSNVLISSSSSAKSKTSAFFLMRSALPLLGSGTQPCCRAKRMSIWAGVLPCLSAIFPSVASSRLSPQERGLYAAKTTPLSLQYCVISRCWHHGWS